LGGVAEEGAVWGIDEGIASREDAKGAEGFEAGRGAAEACVELLEGRGAGGLEALGEGLEAVAVGAEA
jgi:RNA-splicing ligase RtcB